MHYAMLIDHSDAGYGGIIPDLRGCVAMGDTVEGLLAEASSVMGEWMRLVEADGQTVPPPRTIAELREDPDVIEALAEGAVFGLVPVIRETGRNTKANLSIDTGILAAIDAAASRQAISRSAMVEALARRGLPEMA